MAGKHHQKAGDRWLQATMAIIGAAAVLGLMGIFIAEAVRGEDGPPEIELMLTEVTQTGATYVAEVRARNGGASTAANVMVEGRLANGETAQMTFDYLPDGSSRMGGLVFETDPRAGGLSLRVLGYSDP